MKTIYCFLAFSVLLLSSCSKDNETSTGSNNGSMSYLGKTYRLNEARITTQQQQNGIYSYSLALYADDVKWNNGTFSKGHYLSLVVYCNNGSGVKAGTYIESFDEDFVNMTANSSTFFTISSEYPYSSYALIHPNKVNIKVDGSTYDILITGEDGVEREFSAQYKGTLKKMY